MPTPIRLHLSRQAVLEDTEGRRHTLGTPAALVAARLALAGAQPRAALAALLWPDAGEARARANLRQLLLRLRTLAGTDWIAGDAVLELAAGVEVVEDEQVPLLEGVTPAGLDEAQDWLAATRAQRLQARVRSCEQACARAEADGRLPDAIDAAHRLIALDPLSEAHHRTLMRLHYLNHDRGRALAAHAALERMLADEHGAAPSAETRELLRLIESAGAAPARTSPRVSAALLHPPRLVGREAELAALLAHLHGSQLALIEGEGGLGKSRLLGETLRALAGNDERAVLAVGARPGDAVVAYAFAVRCIAPLVARVAGTGEPWRADLAPLIDRPGGGAAIGGDGTHRLVRGFTLLLQAAAAQGLRVIALDDLHLADAASLELLAPQLAGGHCAWVLVRRPAEGAEVLHTLVRSFESDARTLSLTLKPLDASSVGMLLDTLGLPGLDGASQGNALHRHTGGNPLYLLETLKALPAWPDVGAPRHWPHAPNVLRLIEQRLARLSPLATKVARCAAVAGPDMTPALVSRVLGIPAIDLAEAWAELDAAQVLHARGFAHDLIAEAVQGGLPAAVAEPLHAEVAAQLEAGQAEPARTAAHWLAAHDALKAVPHLRAAAGRAAALWRRREAMALLRQAAAILVEHGRHAEAFEPMLVVLDFATDSGDVETVQACEPTLAALAAAAPSASTRAGAELARSWLEFEHGHMDAALRHALAAVAPPDAAGTYVQALLLHHLASLHWERRDVAGALASAEQALALIEAALARGDTSARHLRLALSSFAGMAACGLSHYAQGCARIEQAWQIASREQEMAEVSYATRMLAIIMMYRGDVAAARLWGDRALDAMRAAEQRGTAQEAHALAARMHHLLAEGDLGAALAASDRIAELNAAQAVGPSVLNVEERALLLHELGRPDLARATVPAPRPDEPMAEVQRARRGAARATLGLAGPADIEQALAHARETADLNLRARLLWATQPGAAPAVIEPLLAQAAGQAWASGGHGLWAMLQSRRLAALRALGDPARTAEARAIALDLWPRIERGLSGLETFARMASGLAATLGTTDPDLADTIALRAGGWMLKAAATLPPGWRENYLARSPLLDVLPPRGRSALRGLGLASAEPAVSPRRSPG